MPILAKCAKVEIMETNKSPPKQNYLQTRKALMSTDMSPYMAKQPSEQKINSEAKNKKRVKAKANVRTKAKQKNVYYQGTLF